MSARLAVASIAGLLTATAASAAACPAASHCFCVGGAGGTVEAQISSIDGPRTSFLVSVPLGNVGGLDAGDTLTLPRAEGDAVGTRWLFQLSGQLVFRRYAVDGDGGVECVDSATPLVLPVATVEDLAASVDCPDKLQSLGFTPRQCHTTGPLGCSSIVPGSSAALFGLLVFLRVRRRHPASPKSARGPL